MFVDGLCEEMGQALADLDGVLPWLGIKDGRESGAIRLTPLGAVPGPWNLRRR